MIATGKTTQLGFRSSGSICDSKVPRTHSPRYETLQYAYSFSLARMHMGSQTTHRANESSAGAIVHRSLYTSEHHLPII